MIKQNTARGLLITAVALFFLVQAYNYPFGSLNNPSLGLFPLLVAGTLLVIGIVITAYSFFAEAVSLDFQIRNMALVTGSLVSFALVSEYLNMLAAIVVMVPIASLAGKDFSIRRAGAIVVVLCLVAVAMREGLGVQLPLY